MKQVNAGSEVRPPEWLAHELRDCMQCGTCSGVCSVAAYSDSCGPRKLFALMAAGDGERALASDHLWLCTSCQACTDSCPKKLHVSSMVGGLKQMALDSGTAPKGDAQVQLMRHFSEIVESGGRISEFSLMRRVLGFRPDRILRNSGVAMRLLSRGRLKIESRSIENPEELGLMFQKAEERDGE